MFGIENSNRKISLTSSINIQPHPFNAGHHIFIERTKGLYIYTATGHKFLDRTSGQMSCLLGHGHPEIVKTVADRAAYLDHLFSGMASPPVISLAERLCNVLPPGLDKAFFLSTGGESNEAAIKLARLGASWHGVTAQALGTQHHIGKKGNEPLMPGMHMLPQPNAYRSIFRKPDWSYDWETELEYGWRMIDMESCGSLAACIVEPIQSSAGMHVLPAGYLKALKKHCEKRGMLLVVDEAQTGVGRCGDIMAIVHEDVTPDILPLSKILGNENIYRARLLLLHNTYQRPPASCSWGQGPRDRAARQSGRESRVLGKMLHDGPKKLQSRYGCIGDVRGHGLMAGVEIVADRETKVPELDVAKRVGHNISHPSFGGTFRIAPPITITKEQLEFGLEAMEKALAATPGSNHFTKSH
ncbi:PLP-dependent transferase [Xylariaceae sp. FL1272]|nr:PLP-dependent transferase [Xylariaceae sp. FL1272]